MAYIAAADFRERTLKPWTQGLLLTEMDGTDAYIDLFITMVTTQVELDLDDDFEPPTPDNDEVLELNGSGHYRQFLPRRCRSLTTVKTRKADGTLVTESATAYRLRQSLNAAGTAMVDGAKDDYLDLVSSLSSYVVWPYGTNTVQLTGKFGWAAVPTDIKRLVALRVFALLKAKADPLTTITQRTTADAVITFGPSIEDQDITTRYTRALPVTLG